MVAGNLPEPEPDHLAQMADLALDMHDWAGKLNQYAGGLTLRVGLHVGSVVAGVIGIRKFIYDIWGDVVNTASRLECHGVPGRVHVSEPVFLRLKDNFAFEPRGRVDLKGRGFANTYFLTGRLKGPSRAGPVPAKQPLAT
jgi:adenylate cyclase